ncbi:MAG: FliM/FliN family flagellar motor C-terminal domain-containing protein [Sphingomonas sp.]|nr:FliM/FliN family flagellar motor C-terminal domain-containing protein [Sphingomonas sp.]
MSTAEDWLPPRTTLPARLAAELAARVEGWSTRWFTTNGPRLSRAPAREEAAPLDGLIWEASAGVALGRSADALAALGALALNLDPPVDPRDAEPVERVARECLAELQADLASLLGVAGPWQPLTNAADYRYRAEIGGAGRSVSLRLGLTAGGFARFVKNGLPPVVRPRLDPLTPALARVAVTLGARVGTCRLALDDLTSLAKGDVLVLDSRLEDPLALTLDALPAPRGRARLSQNEDRFTLKIVEPLA